MAKIGLFDTALSDNSGGISSNLGDLIIAKSVDKYFNEIFSSPEMVRRSSRYFPSHNDFDALKKCDYLFIGGTNILSSDINTYNQWWVRRGKFYRLFSSSPIANVVLFGVGWWQYQQAPTRNTKAFYTQTLSTTTMHSVRDSYAVKMLAEMGVNNVLNTSCPTTWELNGQEINRIGKTDNCLFTITDYMRDTENDTTLLQTICENYTGKIYFFPQGTSDEMYLSKLDSFKKNKERIVVLKRTLDEFENCLLTANVDYIGTRLHAGINALQLKKNALILAVDNRAAEMAKDISLPVVARNDFVAMKKWINGEKLFRNIEIPLKNIELWKAQFKAQ